MVYKLLVNSSSVVNTVWYYVGEQDKGMKLPLQKLKIN